MGSMALLITAWVVSDNAPGTATSAWPVAFVVFGWVAALLMPLMINLTMENLGARQFLVREGGFHLVPAAVVTWFTAHGAAGTAYAHVATWCWWALAATAALALAGLLYLAWRGAAAAPAE